MKGDIFKVGDRVALSATFLRSIDPSAAKGWPTRYDAGKGWIMNVIDCAGTDLAEIWFDRGYMRTINTFNIVHEKNIYNEAMRAEHNQRSKRP